MGYVGDVFVVYLNIINSFRVWDSFYGKWIMDENWVRVRLIFFFFGSWFGLSGVVYFVSVVVSDWCEFGCVFLVFVLDLVWEF